ncbi:hypothetical protein [Candidatus Ichthyocystis sparus]|uniref:hypothetical protein n=1 Tax=Candidatus Ichthyocystis sparus TaxID=1561004 RepID=UPI000B82A26B|nr:hypothetical protein [Candidatus Ichthyocystis sparus]
MDNSRSDRWVLLLSQQSVSHGPSFASSLLSVSAVTLSVLSLVNDVSARNNQTNSKTVPAANVKVSV